jgi:MFS superfamily sulfate permease-like transporter
MSLEMQVQEVNGYLSLRAEGRYSFANLSGLFDRVKAESEKRAHHGVILDISKIAGIIPLVDMFRLAEQCSEIWKRSFRIALISPEVGAFNFFEDVARNRGAQLKVVPDQKAAIEWLR